MPCVTTVRLTRTTATSPGGRDGRILQNQGLVYAVARSYAGLGLDWDDLVQAGTEGLIKAVDRYDPERGTAFSTYAVYWIRQAILEALTNTAHLVRIPAHLRGPARRLREAREADDRLSPAARDQVVREAGVSHGVGEALERALAPVASLDTGDVNHAGLADLLSDVTSACPEDVAELEGERTQVRSCLNVLPRNEYTVIVKRFGLEGPAMTLEAIAAAIGLTAERVRQIEGRALKRLKTALTASRAAAG